MLRDSLKQSYGVSSVVYLHLSVWSVGLYYSGSRPGSGHVRIRRFGEKQRSKLNASMFKHGVAQVSARQFSGTCGEPGSTSVGAKVAHMGAFPR